MTENVEKNGDNIDSLCKKYFTPELCAEPVLESKRTLEMKIWTQMEKYGKKLGKDYFALSEDDLEDVVLSTISACIQNWKLNLPSSAYKSYYAVALKNNFANANKKARQKNDMEISMATPLKDKKDGSHKTLEDIVEYPQDKLSDNGYSKSEGGEYAVKFINKIFRMKKRADWWKSLVTAVFYELLHRYFALSEDETPDMYSFIDKTVYDLPSKPTQKEIANILGKDEGQLSRATDKFLALCMENMSDFQAFKDDYELQESLKKYLKDIQDKGKHKKRGEQ